MSIQKKSLLSSLNTTNRAIVASSTPAQENASIGSAKVAKVKTAKVRLAKVRLAKVKAAKVRYVR